MTTHIGSLPRGEVMTELLLAEDNGDVIDGDAFQRAIDDAMTVVVAAQIDAGVDIGGDGEIPRISFSTYVAQRMSGFGGTSARPLFQDAVEFPKWRDWVNGHMLRRARLFDAPAAVAEVRYEDTSRLKQECDAFDRALAAHDTPFAETFMTAASPGIVATTMQNKHYDSHEAYLFALAKELRTEYEAIVARGYLLQIDAPDVAMERACFFQNDDLKTFLGFVEMHIAAINAALDAIPRDRVRFHACFGNRNSPHLFDVECPDILPLLYEVKAGALSLPFANPRHAHEIDAFREHRLPDHMILIPGVIDTVTNYVEHPALIAERLGRAVAAIGDRERVVAGTDCGFSTLAGDSFVAEDVVWAKLKALREGADLASKRLWT
jgi:5-methyltetrahydropteroyltriglutamate--homocysteine methyltransferase